MNEKFTRAKLYQTDDFGTQREFLLCYSCSGPMPTAHCALCFKPMCEECLTQMDAATAPNAHAGSYCNECKGADTDGEL